MKKTYTKPTLVRRDLLVKVAALMQIPSGFDEGIE